MKATVALACLLTAIASGLVTGCATAPAAVAPLQGSTVREDRPAMQAPPQGDRKTQGARIGTASRLG